MVTSSADFFAAIKGNNTYILSDSLDDRKRLAIQVKIYTPVFKQAIGLALGKAELWTKLKDPNATFRILDLGCGEGLYLPILNQYLIDQGAKAHLTMVGVDRDTVAISTAQEYMAALGLRNSQFFVHNITSPLTQIEGLNLNNPSNHFDLVFASTILMHVREPQTVLQHIYKVLKPGGAFYTKDMAWGLDIINYPSLAFTRLANMLQKLTLKMLGEDFGANPAKFVEAVGFENIEWFEDSYPIGGRTEEGRRILEIFLLGQHAARGIFVKLGAISAEEYDGLMEQEFREISADLEGQFKLVNTIARRPLSIIG
ncbi:MAG: class I SAM-dependent methyltransferase [Chloroflexota bacterium]|nr:class I SAM-dependent methyltransferase [Chloroflexota bacterium]